MTVVIQNKMNILPEGYMWSRKYDFEELFSTSYKIIFLMMKTLYEEQMKKNECCSEIGTPTSLH